MEKTKLRPYLVAAALLILAPFALADFVKTKKTAIVTALVVTTVFVIGLLLTGACVHSKTDEAADGLGIVDVSWKYTTGNMRRSTDYLIIHHTAGGKNCTYEDIAKVHLKERGWSTIGYHYFIDAAGKIYKLHRDGEVAPSTLSYNHNSVAICLSGNFDKYEPTPAQWKSLVALSKVLVRKYHIRTNYIVGHGEVNSTTACPGRYMNIEKLKREIFL